eukprot:1290539-Rhodomonas_salina.4
MGNMRSCWARQERLREQCKRQKEETRRLGTEKTALENERRQLKQTLQEAQSQSLALAQSSAAARAECTDLRELLAAQLHAGMENDKERVGRRVSNAADESAKDGRAEEDEGLAIEVRAIKQGVAASVCNLQARQAKIEALLLALMPKHERACTEVAKEQASKPGELSKDKVPDASIWLYPLSLQLANDFQEPGDGIHGLRQTEKQDDRLVEESLVESQADAACEQSAGVKTELLTVAALVEVRGPQQSM